MFERIVNDPYWKEKHGPLEILSSPGTTGGPWIISLENFVTDEECTRFIELGAEIGYERSEDVADEDLFFGSMDSVQSEGRTSTNAWCMEDCSKDPIVEPVHRRVENLTGFHFNYTEYYQLLRYEPGQFYEEQYVHASMGHFNHNTRPFTHVQLTLYGSVMTTSAKNGIDHKAREC